MSDIREIRTHMESVRDTEKVTKAMHMIAANKLRKARAELDSTRPYFDAINAEIKRVFRVNKAIESEYLYPLSGARDLPGDYAYLVITADKGLAGAYNTSVIRAVEKLIPIHSSKLYVVGEYGRRYFSSRGIKMEENFNFSAYNPTLQRARVITSRLLEDYKKEEISKIFVVYTDFTSGISNSATAVRVLPFHRGDFVSDAEEKEIKRPFIFFPSIEVVLDNMIESYMAGYIYSALVDSFCCEQNSRMNAMEEANSNAEDILATLKLQYNHARQGKITKEITEISSGAKALARKKSERERSTDK